MKSRLSKKQFISASAVYTMYILTGAACVSIGSSLSSLMKHFSVTMAGAAALASAFAVGRVATVFISGWIAEKLGSRTVLAAGTALFLLYSIGIPTVQNYTAALLFTALAGVGQGMQDSSCPNMLAEIFPLSYSSAMGASQAFFGIGCFLPPMIMSFLLANELSWKYMYYILAALAFAILLLTPFVKNGAKTAASESRPREHETQPVKKSAYNAVLYAILAVVTFTYCAVVNICHTYTSSYITSLGVHEDIAVSVLTMFSVGSMAGSLVFTLVLKKTRADSVLWVNSLAGALFLFIGLILKNTMDFFIFFTLAGFFFGVLFSVLITISVELMPSHTAMAAALIAFIGGASDITTPLITGKFVMQSGIVSAFHYAIVMAVIALAASVLLKALRLKNGKRSIVE